MLWSPRRLDAIERARGIEPRIFSGLVSIRQAPERVDGFDEGFGPFGGGEEDAAPLGFLRDQAGFVKAVQMLDGGGLVNVALDGDIVDAECRTAHEQSDNLNATVIGQPRHHPRPPTFTCRHARKHMDLWQ